jgi:uncharacterized membrane protein
MELIRDILLPAHLVAGLAALVLFWVPALTRKGGPAHRAAGRWYVGAMTFIAVSGVVLSLLFLAQGRWQSAVFLLFLGVIMGTSLWNGWRVLRAKRDPALYCTAMHWFIALLNVGGGAGLVALGIASKAPLLYAFGPVGFIIGGGMLALALRRPEDRKYWLYEHFGGMIGSGIGAHVAFFAFGGRQLFGWGTSGYGIALWVTPLVVGVAAITVLNFYYRAQAAMAPAPAASPREPEVSATPAA